MKKYALIQNGKVHEVINIEDNTPTIHDRYHPDFCRCMSDITMLIPQPQVGWLFDWNTGIFAEALGYDLTPPVDPMVAGNTEPPITVPDTPKEVAQDPVQVSELLTTAYDEAAQQ